MTFRVSRSEQSTSLADADMNRSRGCLRAAGTGIGIVVQSQAQVVGSDESDLGLVNQVSAS